jgi:DNA-binding response OmpR family regulator
MTLKLLCAGENDASFQSIKLAFEKEDVIIIRATSIALALFLSRKNRPHLIICESNLIDGTAINLFGELGNEQDLDKIPFAFLLADRLRQAEILSLFKNESRKKNIHFFCLEKESIQSDECFNLKNEILKIIN